MLMKVTNSVQKNDKAQKLGAAIQHVFKQHQAQVGSKTLTSIAWCFATVER